MYNISDKYFYWYYFDKSINNMATYCFRTIEDQRTNDKGRSDQKGQST